MSRRSLGHALFIATSHRACFYLILCICPSYASRTPSRVHCPYLFLAGVRVVSGRVSVSHLFRPSMYLSWRAAKASLLPSTNPSTRSTPLASMCPPRMCMPIPPLHAAPIIYVSSQYHPRDAHLPLLPGAHSVRHHTIHSTHPINRCIGRSRNVLCLYFIRAK